MNNLSQDNETSLETLKNNEIKETHSAISNMYNVFRLYGMVFNDLQKKYRVRKITAQIVLKVAGGTIVNLYAYDKVADEMATLYKNGDWIIVEGKIKSKVDENNNINLYLVVYSHRLVSKNLNIESIKDHEYHFRETEQLYDPFKVKERMLEGEKEC